MSQVSKLDLVGTFTAKVSNVPGRLQRFSSGGFLRGLHEVYGLDHLIAPGPIAWFLITNPDLLLREYMEFSAYLLTISGRGYRVIKAY